MGSQADHIITNKDRTVAHIALAAADDGSIPCPDVAGLALLLDSRLELSEVRQDELWNHLASCPTCYEQWRIVSELQVGMVKKRNRGRIIAIGGSLLAAAASIMLFVNIQSTPVPEKRSVEHQPAVLGSMVESESPVPFSPAEVAEPEMAKQKIQQVQKKSLSRPAARVLKEEAVSSPSPLQSSSAEEKVVAHIFKEDSLTNDSSVTLDQEGITGEILLDVNKLAPTVIQKIKQAAVGDLVEVKTYKRDRGFTVEKRADEQVFIREFGYKDQETIIPITKLKKTLKTIIKTEFPRSNKVWLRSIPSSMNK